VKAAWAWLQKWGAIALAGLAGAMFFLWRLASGERDAERKGRVTAEGQRDEAKLSAERERKVADERLKAAAGAETKRLEADARAKAVLDESAKRIDDAKAKHGAEVDRVREGSLADEGNRRIDEGRL